jgi:hypothetical protein
MMGYQPDFQRILQSMSLNAGMQNKMSSLGRPQFDQQAGVEAPTPLPAATLQPAQIDQGMLSKQSAPPMSPVKPDEQKPATGGGATQPGMSGDGTPTVRPMEQQGIMGPAQGVTSPSYPEDDPKLKQPGYGFQFPQSQYQVSPQYQQPQQQPRGAYGMGY